MLSLKLVSVSSLMGVFLRARFFCLFVHLLNHFRSQVDKMSGIRRYKDQKATGYGVQVSKRG